MEHVLKSIQNPSKINGTAFQNAFNNHPDSFQNHPVVRFGFLLISIAPLRLVLLGPLCFSIGFRFGFYCVPPCFSMAPLRFSIGTPSFSIVFYWGPSFYHWVSLRLLHRRNTWTSGPPQRTTLQARPHTDSKTTSPRIDHIPTARPFPIGGQSLRGLMFFFYSPKARQHPDD